MLAVSCKHGLCMNICAELAGNQGCKSPCCDKCHDWKLHVTDTPITSDMWADTLLRLCLLTPRCKRRHGVHSISFPAIGRHRRRALRWHKLLHILPHGAPKGAASLLQNMPMPYRLLLISYTMQVQPPARGLISMLFRLTCRLQLVAKLLDTVALPQWSGAHPGSVGLGNAQILYNALTRKFVLFFHLDTVNFKAWAGARASGHVGVLTADKARSLPCINSQRAQVCSFH